ncbi:cupin domain-containing protein [Jeotgalibaca caeni]|uniref:cupin domain-containing protein n=1 Tax=Jeotgalibaca caeni TaxID=3028623 RepID=UPI00237D34C8|nr:cupin domain-containing protein [Jeotgalibaca caeni]MDE1548329.1 cupin domain-containing protein [Jeotgalibaca caeni]
MAEKFYAKENKPYPNHPLPILYYPGAIMNLLEEHDPAQEVLSFLAKNGYTNGWVNGILPEHHFHSNTHEVLACIAGEAHVQLGGPDAEIYPFKKGDIVLLPAGTTHKRIKASDRFRIVGAYPDGLEPDMQKGDGDYEKIKKTVAEVAVPETDPVDGKRIEEWE